MRIRWSLIRAISSSPRKAPGDRDSRPTPASEAIEVLHLSGDGDRRPQANSVGDRSLQARGRVDGRLPLVATQKTWLDRDANFFTHSIAYGGALVRNDIRAMLGW